MKKTISFLNKEQLKREFYGVLYFQKSEGFAGDRFRNKNGLNKGKAEKCCMSFCNALQRYLLFLVQTSDSPVCMAAFLLLSELVSFKGIPKITITLLLSWE